MDSTLLGIHIGEYGVAAGPVTLAVHGLGSCVALLLHDPAVRVGGLAHILLPGPRPIQDASSDLPAKYAPEAVDVLVEAMVRSGARASRLRAAVVGGASLFRSDADLDQGIGTRNAAALAEALAERGLTPVVNETGGTEGRSVYFTLPEGILEIKTLREGLRELPFGGRSQE